jgi:hypothetical protein
MRITGLLILLLFFLIVFASPAASYAQTASTNTPNPSVNSAKPAADDASIAFDRALRELARRGGTQIERDGVCYTMRTYVMAREEKDSDVTRMVRMTRCMPASKVEFKSAVQPVHEGED